MKKILSLLLLFLFVSSCSKTNCKIDKGIVVAIQQYDFPQNETLLVIRGFCEGNLTNAEVYVPDSLGKCVTIGYYYKGTIPSCDTING